MAISYPRSLPATPLYNKSRFQIVRMTSGPQRTRGGAVQNVDFGDSYWRARYETVDMVSRNALTFVTWLDSLRGGLKTFLGYDPVRTFPSAYASEATVLSFVRFGGGSFNGTFGITAITAPNRITSDGAANRPPPLMVLREGDYIGLSQSGKYSLHRIVEQAQSNSSGNFGAGAEIYVEPEIKTSIFTAAAVANVVRPLAEFILLPETIDYDPNARETRVSFEAESKVMI